MTEKEVIKALDDRMYCGKWIGKGFLDKKDFQILKNAFDLINRQQAEIERLNSCVKSEDEVRAIANATIQAGIKIIKAETIKELEAKIHEKLHEAEMHGNFEPVVTREMFDSVVKEMVGEQQ